MTKLAKKETTAVALPLENRSWGSENIDASDIVIPKLLLMQGQSKFVAAGKARAGDIVKSTTGEVVGGAQKGVKVIAFMTFKEWDVSEKNGGRFEFRFKESVTPSNVNDSWEFTKDGNDWRRDLCINFYALLPSDIERLQVAMAKLDKTGELPDPADALLPVVLSFRRTSYRAGKDLISHFAKAASFHQPPAVSTFELGSVAETKDKDIFQVFKITPAGKTPAESISLCHTWYNTIKGNGVKVDDSDLQEDAPKQAKPTAKPQTKEVDLDLNELPF